MLIEVFGMITIPKTKFVLLTMCDHVVGAASEV